MQAKTIFSVVDLRLAVLIKSFLKIIEYLQSLQYFLIFTLTQYKEESCVPLLSKSNECAFDLISSISTSTQCTENYIYILEPEHA